ncbi:hypothetical protein BRADI_1g77308v3 [Brachypodium distachyon]|uniref:Uncharacterized protein n=1 Tax=Brachypodium distachyon TaxID=15368 RepID=A0A0Q3KIA2_BRADI|nr:hypothetical protein BRADI_1g77308v3 [Brachypodium distachyon]
MTAGSEQHECGVPEERRRSAGGGGARTGRRRAMRRELGLVADVGGAAKRGRTGWGAAGEGWCRFYRFVAAAAAASEGDADPVYRSCVEECQRFEQAVKHCVVPADDQPADKSWYAHEPLYLQWKEWNCNSECRYKWHDFQFFNKQRLNELCGKDERYRKDSLLDKNTGCSLEEKGDAAIQEKDCAHAVALYTKTTLHRLIGRNSSRVPAFWDGERVDCMEDLLDKIIPKEVPEPLVEHSVQPIRPRGFQIANVK